MATPSKKGAAKVPAVKKVAKAAAPAAPKPVKTSAPKPVKVEKGPTKSFTPGGVIFEVVATIPTMPYGNIMPRIQVVVNTIEEGRAMVMPVIEELYHAYAEKPRDGSKLSFQRASVTETVKEVVPVPMPTVAAPVAPQAQDTPAPAAQDVPAPQATAQAAPEAAQAPVAPTETEFAARARKMIGLAMTEEAAQKIKGQIEGSEKIPPHEKPALLELVEAKITDFQSNVW